jgi:phosphohistidine swiveling domain-containing protein
MKYILHLKEADSWTRASAGGKGAALAELKKMGANVPDAFCITVDAYRAYVEQSVAKEAVQRALHQFASQVEAADIENIVEKLRDALLGVPIPSRVANQIKAAYTKLATPRYDDILPVAVRSSATDEDLPDASFAGLYDSFLGIQGDSNVLDAVHKCWASIWSARAIQYRNNHQLNHNDVFMGVIVQRMVNANVSGVSFTANPITGDTSQMLTNSIWGLGEILVSGEVTPDEWIISKETGEILRKKISRKEIMMMEVNGEVQRAKVSTPKCAQATLTYAQLMTLRSIGIQLEEYFGFPLDIEWALREENFYILQARPITKSFIKNNTTTTNLDNKFEIRGYWTRLGFEEWLQEPLSPLFATLILPRLSTSVDLLIKSRLKLSRKPPTWCVLNGYYYARGDIACSPQLFLAPQKFIQNIGKVADEWHNDILPRQTGLIGNLSNFDNRQATAVEIYEHLNLVLEANSQSFAWVIFTGVMAKISVGIFSRLYKFIMGKTDLDYFTLLSGFPNKSIEADEALWQLSKLASSSDDLRSLILNRDSGTEREWLEKIKSIGNWYDHLCEWINLYGHRVFNLDILYKTMQDDPFIALQVIRNYVESNGQSPDQRRQQREQERMFAEKLFQDQLAKKSFWVQRLLLYFCNMAQRYAAIRENRPFYLHVGWPLMRRDILELGRRFVVYGLLQSVEDIFFLNADEFRNFIAVVDEVRSHDQTGKDLDFRVRNRKKERENQQLLFPPDHLNPNFAVNFLLNRLLSKSISRDTDILLGSSGSSGKARGYACIVRSQRDFIKFNRGNILVAPYTNPAWTPLLSLAAGVVTERGGALSHAAIISREYGIPAVLGVLEATSLISDGDEIVVDGNSGRVILSG